MQQGADPDETDRNGNTALHHLTAAAIAHSGTTFSVIQALVKAGADCDRLNQDGNTPLHLAAGNDDSSNATLSRLLLNCGADPTAANQNGNTPLHTAIIGTPGSGFPTVSGTKPPARVLQVLLDNGADPDARNQEGQSSLLLALEHAGPAEVTRLVQGGADPNARYQGEPLLVWVANRAAQTTSASDEEKAIALVRGGAKPNTCSQGEQPALIKAARGGLESLGAALLKAGADPCLADVNELTATPASITLAGGPSEAPTTPMRVAGHSGYPRLKGLISQAGGDDTTCYGDGGFSGWESAGEITGRIEGTPGRLSICTGPVTRNNAGAQSGAATPLANRQPKCAELPGNYLGEKHAQCWLEIANLPGCYIFDDHYHSDRPAKWTGQCSGGLREGRGTLSYAAGSEHESMEATGAVTAGKRHGQWVVRYADGDVSEGPYVDGKRHGQWVLRTADGDVQEGPYVDGKRHGQWVLRFADGRVEEGPVVDGKQHGQWVARAADGDVQEGPIVDGKHHGQWVRRYADGTTECDEYVHGEYQGECN